MGGKEARTLNPKPKTNPKPETAELSHDVVGPGFCRSGRWPSRFARRLAYIAAMENQMENQVETEDMLEG